ncbi:DUF4115 domain-containing protein [Halomonas sp. I1]|uniref:RodZ domain-containing protein n=1 Tax=Halomonas sp. I1 TaxID=393536 RepID=UPI0028DFA641|nr:RodZ domain-containing protein [Halomonas sp. I1]MDT8895419.1 DUF4115 domain-containing protein [Halomonas sp. I1]
MSDTPLQDPDAVTPQASPGELLRRERDALELSREEVAAALNLRPAVIDGLESDSYEEIPIATYRRGYLRSYANLLGLDEDRVLSAYKAHFGKDDLEQKVTPVHIVNKPPSRIGAWLFRLATLVVIAGLIGLTLMWWQSRGGSQPPSPSDSAPVAVDGLDGSTAVAESGTGDTPSPAPENGAEAPAETVGDASQAAVPTDDQPNLLGATDESPVAEAPTETSTPEASTTEATDASSADDSSSTDEAATDDDAATDAEGTDVAASDQATQADPRVLNLTFNEQSWTEIFDANNQRVFVGLQEPGTTARVEGDPPFRLTVGNATGVELSWGDETVDLSERAGANNVARFTLGE